MVAEFGEEGLMQEVLDVLGIVEGCGGCGGFGGFAVVAGLTRIDSCDLRLD